MAEAQFINAPNNLKKAKVGSGRAKLDPQVLARAEKVVEKIQQEYTAWADEDMAAFDTVLAELKSTGCDQPATIKKIFSLSLDMKGQGGSFGYLLMSEVAASLNDFIAKRTRLSPLDIEVVDSHISTLHAIFRQNVRDDGGETGRALIAGLQRLVTKADTRGNLV